MMIVREKYVRILRFIVLTIKKEAKKQIINKIKSNQNNASC
jgi:hypothetical protein